MNSRKPPSIPNDNYWNNSTLPNLYFIDLNKSTTTNSSFNILRQLAIKNIQITNDLGVENNELNKITSVA